MRRIKSTIGEDHLKGTSRGELVALFTYNPDDGELYPAGDGNVVVTWDEHKNTYMVYVNGHRYAYGPVVWFMLTGEPNGMEHQTNSATGLRGVSMVSSTYRAQITAKHGETEYLGSFKGPFAAFAAYIKARLEMLEKVAV